MFGRKLRVAIDLNDVVRAFSMKLEYLYNANLEDMKDWGWVDIDAKKVDLLKACEGSDGDFRKMFPFKTPEFYNKFVYEEVSFELFGRSANMNMPLIGEMNVWLATIAEKYKGVEVFFVCPNEHRKAIMGTCGYLGNMMNVRKVLFTQSSKETWKACDVLITASPLLIRKKPWCKTAVKIVTPYNKDVKCKFTYKKLNDFIKTERHYEGTKFSGAYVEEHEPWKRVFGVD